MATSRAVKNVPDATQTISSLMRDDREPVTRLPLMIKQGSDSHDRTYRGSPPFFNTLMGFGLGVNDTRQECSPADPMDNLSLETFLGIAQNSGERNPRTV
ncbi:uncharacterized protein SETTUDRAFT_28925 [Exserohilum turcica Et28A]|uniref:Uncharacterized protein n=1 Tax=Exserohilum turcicum (strain 28A) TaxID=671987 RepID=R0IMG7_EXST2|nr:uncharacterized protein SETTUDRAFT_28925 [Exserohilum turcica Et28A]EOA85991.1 hypothetical protein SETTUDRAFT_28925 [Exserohilum turcica Et28A]